MDAVLNRDSTAIFGQSEPDGGVTQGGSLRNRFAKKIYALHTRNWLMLPSGMSVQVAPLHLTGGSFPGWTPWLDSA